MMVRPNVKCSSTTRDVHALEQVAVDIIGDPPCDLVEFASPSQDLEHTAAEVFYEGSGVRQFCASSCLLAKKLICGKSRGPGGDGVYGAHVFSCCEM
jgi:hypothetical protein